MRAKSLKRNWQFCFTSSISKFGSFKKPFATITSVWTLLLRQNTYSVGTNKTRNSLSDGRLKDWRVKDFFELTKLPVFWFWKLNLANVLFQILYPINILNNFYFRALAIKPLLQINKILLSTNLIIWLNDRNYSTKLPFKM